MAKEDKDKMMLLLLLSMMSMISGGDLKEELMKVATLVTGFGPNIDVGTCSPPEKDVKYLHGIRGLADHLGVSIPTAQKYKDSGILDSAIRRVGRQFNFDAQKVDEVFNPQNK